MILTNVSVSLGLRAAQVLFAIISLGLAASVTDDLSYGYRGSVFIVVVSVLSLLYLVFTLVPLLLGIVFPFLAILAEAILLILWFAAFVVITNDVGGASCSGALYYYSWSYSWCRKAKALIAFSLFEWLLSIATVVLLSYYTLMPLSKAGGFNNLLTKRTLVWGAIFPTQAPSAAEVTEEDLEKNAAVEPALTDSPVSTPAPISETAPVASETAPEAAPEAAPTSATAPEPSIAVDESTTEVPPSSSTLAHNK